MTHAEAEPGRAGYRPALAMRHLLAGPTAPRRAMVEALSGGIGEVGRLVVFALFVATLGLVDPETRALGRAAWENAADDGDMLQGLGLLATGAVAIGLALFIVYWLSAVAANLLCGAPWTRETLARMRSAVALSGWFSLLPTVALKLAALAVLPKAMVVADPPSLYSALEIAVLVPYFAACLVGAGGIGPLRAAIAALLINGGLYLALALLALIPSD